MQQKTARQIRDEIFKCNVTSKLYDPVHDKILNKTKLNDMHGISLALCSTNKMNSKNRHDRELFIKSIIAVTNWVNDRIIEQRNFVLSVQKKMKNGLELSPNEKEKFSMICSFYQTKKIDELLLRVAPIPISLAVAQAAIESGFGSNALIHKHNAFFGMMKDSKNLLSFNTLLESTIAYSKTLNVNSLYKQFRQKRADMTAKSETIDVGKLSDSLKMYSENACYHTLLMQLIKEYDLSSFDKRKKFSENNNVI